MHLSSNDRLGFELGWDYALNGICPPKSETGEVPIEVAEGFTAGKLHFELNRPKPHQCEIEFKYRKKLLNLRLSAFRRSRILCDDVTPGYLKSIDGNFCPVTRIQFTHGLGLPTDASIERINNHGGYAAGNICTLSSAANQAKGSRSFTEVLTTALQVEADEVKDGLTMRQWMRLASLSSYGCDADEQKLADEMPMLCCPLPGCSLGSKVMAMKFITSHLALPSLKRTVLDTIVKAYKKLGDKRVDRALKKFHDCSKGAYNRAFHRAESRTSFYLMEDCWQNPVLFDSWTNLAKLVGDRFADVAVIVYPLARQAIFDLDNLDTGSWGLENGGYLQD